MVVQRKKSKTKVDKREAELDEEYTVGQVASCIQHSSGNFSNRLAELFGSPAPQGPGIRPSFVAVPPKRSDDGEAQIKKGSPIAAIICKPSKAAQARSTQVEKTTLHEVLKSPAARRIAQREQALRHADEKQEQRKNVGKKQKKECTKRHPRTSGMESDGGEVDEDMPAKRQKLNPAAEAERTACTVFVGNLPVSCKKQTLKKMFEACGTIQTIRFRSVARADPTMTKKQAAIQRKVHPKRSNINAYVVFREQQSVSEALQRNGAEIQDGFHIRVDSALGEKQHDHKRSIFVGNLPYDIEEEAVRRHFEMCGPISGVRIVRDNNSGLGKGFGFILFESADGVSLALQLQGSELSGRKVRIRRSVHNPTARKEPPAAVNRDALVKKKKKKVDKADKPSWLVKSKGDFVGEKAKQRVRKDHRQVKCKKQVNLWANKSKCKSDSKVTTQHNNCMSKGKNILKGRSYKK
uniref:RNA-binding protein 34 n=1 Tax=Myxine glutinosa TaxID=7769 RepID=UPI00358FFB25